MTPTKIAMYSILNCASLCFVCLHLWHGYLFLFLILPKKTHTHTRTRKLHLNLIGNSMVALKFRFVDLIRLIECLCASCTVYRHSSAHNHASNTFYAIRGGFARPMLHAQNSCVYLRCILKDRANPFDPLNCEHEVWTTDNHYLQHP